MKNALFIYEIMGLLIMGLSVPLIKEKVRINNWYGIRLPSTMKDKKVWYEANKAGGRNFFILGALIFILSILLFFQDFIPSLYSLIIISVVIFIGTVFTSIKTAINAERVSKENKTRKLG